MSTSVTLPPCYSQWRGEGWSNTFTPSPTPSPHHTPVHTPTLWGRAANKCSADRLIALTRKWIEDCTACVSANKSYREYLQDGTVLCKLVHSIQPGLIRKINYVKSPFAWRENLSFFCEACLGLGLKSSQLFTPEDLLVSGTTTHSLYKPRLSSQDEERRKLQSVALTVFLLGCKVAELPEYSGPLLNPEDIADSSTSTKTLSLTSSSSSRENSIAPPERSSTAADPLNTGHTLILPVGNSQGAQEPVLPQVTETIKLKPEVAEDTVTDAEEPTSPVVPDSARQRKISNVSSLVAETSDTDTQSFPQVVRFPNQTPASPKSDQQQQHAKKIPLRHTKSEPGNLTENLLKVPSNTPRTCSGKGHNRQLSDSNTIITTDRIVQEEFERSKSAEIVHVFSETRCTVFESSPQNSQETFEDPRELVCSTTPSEASTVILREHLSRCSTHSTTGKSEFSETESTLNSPITPRRPLETFEDPEDTSNKTATHSSQSDQDLQFVQTPVISPPLELSNPSYASEATPVDHTGLISLEFCQELNSNSQETTSISLYSPDAVPFHFNLTQTSQDPAGSDLEPSLPNIEAHSENSLEQVSGSVKSGERTYSDTTNPEGLGHIREESGGFDLSSPVVYRVPLNRASEHSTSSSLAAQVRLTASCETFSLDSLPSNAAAAAASKQPREASLQSRQSSLSSITSSNCSYIVVSYTTGAGSAHQENVADIGIASDVAVYNSNTIDCYYSDTSDDKSAAMEVLNAQNTSFGRSSMISTAAVPCEGHNHKSDHNPSNSDFHSRSNNGQNEPSSVASGSGAGAGKLILYSSSPLLNASGSGNVPHHSLSIATSGPDSPSSFQAVEKGGQPSSLEEELGRGYQELTVSVIRLPGEKQLGVSLAGGGEEGCPHIDAITGASPAARSALQCSDQLLAVNGVSLQDTTHSQATTILNEAASKDKVVFRVRRPLESSTSHHSPSTTSTHLPTPTTSTPYNPLPPQLLRIHQSPPVDLTRVHSDALPSSMHASKVVCELPDREPLADTPDFLSDANSMAVEIGSSLDGDLEKVSMSGSHMDIQMEEGSAELAGNSGMEDKLMHFVLLTKGENVKEGRPYSAPSRSISTGAMPLGTSHTLPSNISGAEISRMKGKRASINEEREKRKANIAESARAAHKYRTNRNSIKSDTPSREYRSSSLSSKSGCSDDEFFKQHNSNHVRKSSSPAMIARALHQQDDPVNNPSSSPLNLRNMSIDDTKEASFSQMAEIWRQVEEGGDGHDSVDAAATVKQTGKRSQVRHTGSRSSVQKAEIENVTPILGDGKPEEGTNTADKPDSVAIIAGGSPSHSPEASEENFPRPKSEVLKPADIELSLVDSSPRHKATSAVNGNVHDGAILAPPTLEDKRSRAPSFSNKDIDSLLSTLRSLSVRGEEEEELKVLENMLKSNTFKKAKQVHDSMHSVLLDDSSAIRPVIRRIVPISQLMRQHLHHHTEPSAEVNELRELVRKPHVQAVLFTHDKVSSRDLYVPDRKFPKASQDPVDIILSGSVYNFQAVGSPIDTSAPLSREVPSTRKEDATIVFLERTNRPLGCTIYKQEDSVFIGKLLKGCDAEQNEVLREGDELLEVNGVPVMQKSTDEIVRLMSGDQPGTTLAFTIIPVHDDNVDVLYEPKYVRAHFNYNGRCDEEIPCKALGLSFTKGDILEISNQDDPHWWQARKVFDDGGESLPGLIPARHLQQQREAMIRSYPFSSAIERKKGFKSVFSKKKKKKIYYQNTPPSNVLGVGDEVVTYEDVAKLESDPDLKRPIILIGAPGVGRRTLIRKLFNHDSSHYAPVVQHTTRGIRPGEANGHDYYFVTREEFERDVENDRFLEYGELRGHYYGLAFSSIKKVMESGRVPVLDLHPQALKKIRHSGLKPYIIFIASPRMERLQMTRRVGSQKLKRKTSGASIHMDDMQIYTESDLHHLMEESYLIENQYGHYFDWIIVNDDFQVAADMLKEVSRRLEEEEQWVPVSWTMEQF